MKTNRTAFRPVLLVLAIAALAPTAGAATFTKANNATDLNLATSWTSNTTVPGSTDVALWDSTVTANNQTLLGADMSWQGIQIINPAGTVRIDNNTLTLGASGIDASTYTSTLTLYSNVILGASQIWAFNTKAEIYGSTLNNGGYTLTINGPAKITSLISGSGGLTKTGSGVLEIWGANTYNGTTTINSGTLWTSGATGSVASSALITGNGTGALYLAQTANYTLGSQITGTLKVYNAATGSTVTLTGANTYDGATYCYGGALSVSSIGSWAASNNSTSNLGAPTTSANGVIYLGNLATTGTLIYTGTGETTNRVIGFDGTTGGATIDQSGTGLLKFTGIPLNYIGGNKTLTLQGSTAGSGEINGGINQNGSVISLTKTGNGTWTLSGANNYTGVTTLSAGTLNLGIAENVNVTGPLGKSVAANPGSIVLGGGTLQYSAANTYDYSGRFSTAVGQAYNVDTNGQAVTWATALTSSGGTLAKSGSGTLTLTGPNTYTGTTTLSAGTLNLGVAEIAGTSGPLGNSVAANPGSIVLGGGTLQYSAANTYDYSGRFSTAAGQAYNVDTNGQAVTWATALTSSGGTLAKSGSGTLTLTGANTYNGTTTINSGNLQVGNGGATGSLGSGNVTNNATLAFNLSSSPSLDGVISGTGALTKSGSGTLTLNGANTYTGITTLSAGTLNLGVAEIAGTSGPLGKSVAANPGSIVMGGGTLQYSAANTNDYSGRFSTAAGQAYNVDTNGQAVTWATGLTSVGGNLTKSGSGTLTLSGTNTYAGNTTISGGTLQINTPGAISSSGGIIDNANLTFNLSGQLNYGNAISGNGSVTLSGSNPLAFTGANTYTGQTIINSSYIMIGNGAAPGSISSSSLVTGNGGGLYLNWASIYTFANTINGTLSSLTYGATGAVTLTGPNTFDGSIQVYAGSLSASSIGSWAASNNSSSNLGAPTTSANGVIHLGNAATTGTLIYTGTGETTNRQIGFNGGNSGGATIDQSGAGLLKFTAVPLNYVAGNKTLTLQGSTSGTGEISGGINQNGSVISLTKAGNGTWTLSGTNNYTGATTVNGGTLLINGSTTASSAVAVNSGGTLGGSGTVNGAVTVNSGGTLAPGNSPGLLTVGSLVLSVGSATIFEINGTSRGSTYDAINIVSGGALQFGGALTLSFGSALTNGDSLSLFSFNAGHTSDFASVSSTGSYVGTWNQDVPSDTWSYNNGTQVLTFSELTGGMTVGAYPEPSTWVLLTIGMLAVLVFHRRNQSRAFLIKKNPCK